MIVEPTSFSLKVRIVSNEVVYSDDLSTNVSCHDIENLVQRALSATRRRARLCVHKDVQDPLHEMLIVHTRDAYVRPHKHLNKVESLHIIEGVADLVLFDEEGAVTAFTHMGDYPSGLVFFSRISEPCYHTLLIRSERLVFHEVTEGPFNRADTMFAPWSPEDSDLSAAEKYVEQLSSQLRKSGLSR
jgi:cupin fold WbuC family metalloprotein